MRDAIAQESAAFLRNMDFKVANFVNLNSCFDLVAKKNNETYLIKILSNIDSLRQGSAIELKRMSQLFHGIPFIVGEKTKAGNLENGLIYERHGIKAANTNTFKKFFSDDLPEIIHFKGKNSVLLNQEKLVSARKEKALSKGELAEKVGVSRTTIARFENGKPSSIEIAKKIEAVLGKKLVKPFTLNDLNPKKIGENIDFEKEPFFEKLEKIGLKLNMFSHAPFKAFNEFDEELFIERCCKSDLHNKINAMEKVGNAFEKKSVIFSKNVKDKQAKNTKVLNEEHIYSFSKGKDLLKFIKSDEDET